MSDGAAVLTKDAARKEAIDQREAQIKQAHPRVKRVFVRVRNADQLDEELTD